MSSQDDTSVPLPIILALEQEVDEECDVYLSYDAIAANDEYTSGRLVASSNLTEAEYTISDTFDIPVSNIRNVESDIETDNRVFWLNGCTDDDLEELFKYVTVAYSLHADAAEVDN